MVGSALIRRLLKEECGEILTAPKEAVDLKSQVQTEEWMCRHRPEVVFVSAAKVGGIVANDTYPANFLYDNLMIAANVIHGAFLAKTKKLIYLGSSCIYPKFSKQPIEETELLKGALEPTNEAYSIAKIAGVKLCQAYRRQYKVDFIVGMPTSLYGPGDNFEGENSHVIPALIRKIHEAKQKGLDKIILWGSGKQKREFLHVDDCADALIFLMRSYSDHAPVNIGYGSDIPILELAKSITECIGFHGRIELDQSKPEGTPQKLLSSKVLQSMGWSPKIALKDGLKETYAWFLKR